MDVKIHAVHWARVRVEIERSSTDSVTLERWLDIRLLPLKNEVAGLWRRIGKKLQALIICLRWWQSSVVASCLGCFQTNEKHLLWRAQVRVLQQLPVLKPQCFTVVVLNPRWGQGPEWYTHGEQSDWKMISWRYYNYNNNTISPFICSLPSISKRV